VDGFRILATDQATHFVHMECDVAARNGAGGLWRLGYNIQTIMYIG
jgi:hypothetical protein